MVVPEARFAVTLPPTWVWWAPSDEDQDRIWERAEEVAAADPAAVQQIQVARAGFIKLALMAFGPSLDASHPEVCIVETHRRDPTDPVRPAAEFVALLVALESVASYSDVQPSVAYLTIPAGEAARFDYTDVDTSDGKPDEMSHYILTDGERRIDLMCSAREAPGDRWLAIVETVEFLPISP